MNIGNDFLEQDLKEFLEHKISELNCFTSLEEITKTPCISILCLNLEADKVGGKITGNSFCDLQISVLTMKKESKQVHIDLLGEINEILFDNDFKKNYNLLANKTKIINSRLENLNRELDEDFLKSTWNLNIDLLVLKEEIEED